MCAVHLPPHSVARDVVSWQLSPAWFLGIWVSLLVLQMAQRHPPIRWPTHMLDVADAVAWVARHASEHGGDPHSMVLAGQSAGAHMVTTLGLWPDALENRGVRVIGKVGSPDQARSREHARSGSSKESHSASDSPGASAPGTRDRAGPEWIGTVRGVVPLSPPLSGSRLRLNVFSRKMYMWSVFGPDPVRWDMSFPEGQLRRWLGEWVGAEGRLAPARPRNDMDQIKVRLIAGGNENEGETDPE